MHLKYGAYDKPDLHMQSVGSGNAQLVCEVVFRANNQFHRLAL